MKLSILIVTVAGLAVASAQFGCNVDKVICCVNNYRAKYGLKPLNKDNAICQACRKHSQDMAARRNLDHDGANGSNAGSRMRSQGVNVGGWAENIASGQETEDAVCAAWIKSPGHRRNIVGNYDSVCVARYGDYWAQDFVSYSGSGRGTPVRCSGSAPVSGGSGYQAPSTAPATHVTYRKVLYRRLYSANGHYFYKYYYKLVPVYTRSYHDASGDDYSKDSQYDFSDVKDIGDDYEPEGDYETEVVDYGETAPAAEEPHAYKPKCPPKVAPEDDTYHQ